MPCDYALRSLSPGAWETEASEFDDVGVESLPWLAEAWWSKRQREYFVLTEGSDIRAGALVTSVRPPLPVSGLSVVRGGPLWRRGGRADTADYAGMVELLREEYAGRRGRMLSIQPPADPESGPDVTVILTGLGFREGIRNPYPATYFIDLAVPATDFHAGLHQKWRYNLKKARDLPLDLVLDTSPAGLERFMRLYAAMSKRKQFADSSAVGILPKMFSAGSAKAIPQVFLVRHGGTDVAGAVVSTAGRVATYLHGASADTALPLGAGYFMQWKIIDWLRENTDCRWYNLGSTEGSPGLRQFKSGLVGRTGRVVDEPPSFCFAADNRAMLVGGALERMRAARAAVFRFRSNRAR